MRYILEDPSKPLCCSIALGDPEVRCMLKFSIQCGDYELERNVVSFLRLTETHSLTEILTLLRGVLPLVRSVGVLSTLVDGLLDSWDNCDLHNSNVGTLVELQRTSVPRYAIDMPCLDAAIGALVCGVLGDSSDAEIAAYTKDTFGSTSGTKRPLPQ